MRRTPLAAVLVASALAAGCGADDPAPAPAEPAGRSASDPPVEIIATGLEVPWDIAFLPDGRALVTERPGRVRVVDAQGRLQPGTTARVATDAEGEGGLMGIAVDPDFAAGQRFVYVFVTTEGEVRVQRWRLGEDGGLDLDGVVLRGVVAGSIHDSGRIRFGPDRNLYVVTGDAGRGQLAQRRRSLNGKVLRLTPRQYRSSTRRPAILSRGHRNPQGLDWQPGSGRLWTTEHGPSGGEGGPSGDDEVNIIRRGRNYGWPRVRGSRHGRFARPAFVWHRTVAPSGAAFVERGPWRGDLLVATLAGEALHRLDIRGTRVVRDRVHLRGRYGRLRAVVEAPDGSFWITTSNQDGRGDPAAGDDRILRLRPPG